MKRYPFIYYWIPVVVYAGLIFGLSSYPRPLLPEIEIPFLDKFVHGVEYGVLGFLLYRAFKTSKLRRYAVLLAIALSSFYGLTDEIHQNFVPNREFDLLDLAADSVGATLVPLYLRFRKG